ncbi:ykvA [Acrasis kona]|uniref:YkvA n=1 Tax=Acrasis kona TaxID=1008807 RepID=A0AAW2ZMS0_9EUKA
MTIIAKILTFIPYIGSILKLFYAFFDRNTKITPKILIILAVLYLLSPIDIIPDVIPILGLADDAAIITLALKTLSAAVSPNHIQLAQDTLNRWSL